MPLATRMPDAQNVRTEAPAWTMLNALNSSIMETAAVIEQLETRLARVLVPSAPVPSGVGPAPKDSDESELERALFEMRRSLDGSIARLNILASRLAI